MTSYNYTAAANSVSSMGSNPWEIIYVFDNDPDTTVVCEGYSKAFQYLCDLSEFTNTVEVISVTGPMNGGGHKWNIVKFNGKNYLVDVTNCDNIKDLEEGHTGLFMKGYTSGSVSDGYVITRPTLYVGDFTYPAKDISYAYDNDTLNLYTNHLDVLTLERQDFAPSSGEKIHYTISFDANGGTGTMTDLTDCEEGVKYTLPNCILKRNGYVFSGWNTNENGTGSFLHN